MVRPALLLLALLGLVPRPGLALEPATVRTRSGSVRGAVRQWAGQDGGGEYYSFRGIPYAQPPEGKLVWRDPEPVLDWDTEVGDCCCCCRARGSFHDHRIFSWMPPRM